MTDFRHTIHKRLHNRYGVDAVYYSSIAEPTTVKIKLRVGQAVYGDEVQFVGDEDQVVFLLADITEPQKKEVFVFNNTEYQLVKPLTNDGVRAIWKVRSVE